MLRSPFAAFSLACLLTACISQGDSKHSAQDAQIVQAANNLRQSGDTAGAVRILRQAQASQPDDPIILSQLGYALVYSGQPQEAVNVFDRLMTLNPDNVSAYNGKAVALDRVGNHAVAQELYRQALGLSPDSLGIKNNMAMSMILSDQVDQAIALLEELNRQSAGNPTIRQNLALAYGIKGDKNKALALNMQDMPEAEAQENLRFYEQYAREHKQSVADLPPSLNEILSPSTTVSAAPAPPATPPSPAAIPKAPAPSAQNQPKNDVQAPVPAVTADEHSIVPAAPKSPAQTEASDAVTEPAPFHFSLTPDPNSTYPSENKPSHAHTILSTVDAVYTTPASRKEMAPPPTATLDPAVLVQEGSDDTAADVWFPFHLRPDSDTTYPSQSKFSAAVQTPSNTLSDNVEDLAPTAAAPEARSQDTDMPLSFPFGLTPDPDTTYPSQNKR